LVAFDAISGILARARGILEPIAACLADKGEPKCCALPYARERVFSARQQETLYKLQEARLEVKAEAAERIAAQDKVIRELKGYTWVIRVLFLLLLGGSIYGVLRVQS
jgi:hypothetical protein